MIQTINESFLQDISAHPEDDTPRLIYADWLEDNGDAQRAEFIRVQVELAQSEPCVLPEWAESSAPTDCPHCTLVRRERELLDENQLAWDVIDPSGLWAVFNPTGQSFTGMAPWSWEYRRGFVHKVWCTLPAWLDHGPKIVALHPVEVVVATDRKARHETSAHTPVGHMWCWYSWFQDEEMDDEDLPEYLWKLLSGAMHSEPVPPGYLWWKRYSDAQQADKALSDALLVWAKSPPCPGCKGLRRRACVACDGARRTLHFA